MMKKLNAGSLQLVTFIIVILALLLGSFLLLIHTHKQYSVKTGHIVSISKSVNNHLFSDSRSIDAYKNDDLIEVDSTYWGVFKMVKAEARFKNSKLSKIALVGSRADKDNTALYLADHNSPLVLVGNASIIGDASIPSRGIKTGNISGQSYYGNTFIEGKQLNSGALPLMPSELLHHLDELLTQKSESHETHGSFKLRSGLRLSNSFQNKTKFYYSLTDVFLINLELRGRFIIQSKTKILVNANTQLEDVILIAPEIVVKSGFSGTIQAIASNHIKVEDNVELNYPSALVLKNDYELSSTSKDHQLLIEKNTSIKGTVLVLGRSHVKNYNVQLKTENDSRIEGEVYCSQNLELQGTVNGSVYTNNFIVRHNGTTYQNHLLNGKININNRTKQYVGISLNKGSKEIAKWMY